MGLLEASVPYTAVAGATVTGAKLHIIKLSVSSWFIATKSDKCTLGAQKGTTRPNPVMGISGSLARLWPHHNVGMAAAWGC